MSLHVYQQALHDFPDTESPTFTGRLLREYDAAALVASVSSEPPAPVSNERESLETERPLCG